MAGTFFGGDDIHVSFRVFNEKSLEEEDDEGDLSTLVFISICSNSDTAHQREILDAMWSMWFLLPNYGRRATQFVDLVGYFTIKCTGGSSAVVSRRSRRRCRNVASFSNPFSRVIRLISPINTWRTLYRYCIRKIKF